MGINIVPTGQITVSFMKKKPGLIHADPHIIRHLFFTVAKKNA